MRNEEIKKRYVGEGRNLKKQQRKFPFWCLFFTVCYVMWVIHVTSHHLPLIIPCLVINPTTPFASCSEFHVPLVCVFSNSLQQLHKRETGSVPPPCVVQWVWGGGKCGGLKRSIFEIGNWDPFAHLRKPRFQNHIFDNGVVLGMCQGVHIQEGFGCIRDLVFKLLQGLKRSY